MISCCGWLMCNATCSFKEKKKKEKKLLFPCEKHSLKEIVHPNMKKKKKKKSFKISLYFFYYKHALKYLLFYFTEVSKSKGFGTTWEWVYYDNLHLWVDYPFKGIDHIFKFLKGKKIKCTFKIHFSTKYQYKS